MPACRPDSPILLAGAGRAPRRTVFDGPEVHRSRRGVPAGSACVHAGAPAARNRCRHAPLGQPAPRILPTLAEAFLPNRAGARRTGRNAGAARAGRALRKHIFFEEMYRADAPDFGWQGTHMLAPVLFAFGTDGAMRAIRGAHHDAARSVWCQGFSEPGAGSDLANLKTTAQLVGDEWVINGQKIWTSDAADSDWGFFLVRTDSTVKPQRGLSFIVAQDGHAGHHGAADSRDRRPRGTQRSVPRQRARAARPVDRRARQGLDVREIPARQGAHRERLPVLQPSPVRTREADCAANIRRRASRCSRTPGLHASSRASRPT